jgi:alpha-1,6-mannosyltransferase
LRALFEALRPDVIEVGTHYLLPALVMAATAGLRRKPALVGFYHSDFPRAHVDPALARAPRRARYVARRVAYALVRRQHAGYRATLAASRHVASALGAAGVAGVRCVGLGVDLEGFHPHRRRASPPWPTVLYAGRFARDKELPLLLTAFDKVHGRTGAELVLVGDGPLLPWVRAFARTRPAVRVLGYVDDTTEIAALMASADVLVAPGGRESFSLAAAEAMACGTPVVGADAGGNGELIGESGGGVAFATGRADALADALSSLLCAEPVERRALGQRGRAYAEAHLSWLAVCARILAVYREVL